MPALRVIPCQLSRSGDSRLSIMLTILIYVGLHMKVTLPIIVLITLMVYEIHTIE